MCMASSSSLRDIRPVNQDLGIQYHETCGPIGRRKGVSEVSPDGGHIANLRSADNSRSFRQGHTVLPYQQIGGNISMSDGGADDDEAALLFDSVHAPYRGYIDESINLFVPSEFQIENQIRTARNNPSVCPILFQ